MWNQRPLSIKNVSNFDVNSTIFTPQKQPETAEIRPCVFVFRFLLPRRPCEKIINISLRQKDNRLLETRLKLKVDKTNAF